LATELPRISGVITQNDFSLEIHWTSSKHVDLVDLSDWIRTGSEILKSLADLEVFRAARGSDHGTAVQWDDNHDLVIAAFHLRMLAAEQRKTTS
jgi:hypothetical protein